MEEDIQNCSSTIMFRGTPCTRLLKCRFLFQNFKGPAVYGSLCLLESLSTSFEYFLKNTDIYLHIKLWMPLFYFFSWELCRRRIEKLVLISMELLFNDILAKNLSYFTKIIYYNLRFIFVQQTGICKVNTVQYRLEGKMERYSTVQYATVRYSTVRWIILFLWDSGQECILNSCSIVLRPRPLGNQGNLYSVQCTCSLMKTVHRMIYPLPVRFSQWVSSFSSLSLKL